MTTVVRTIHFAVKSRRKRLVVGAEAELSKPTSRIPRVARLMALAIKYDDLLHRGVVADLSELAHLCQVTQPRMTQIMNLLHLAPDIQEHILFLTHVEKGRDPIHEHMLRHMAACSSWREQRKQWTQITRQTESPASP
ncbi:MAG: hypothetical protein KF869_15470 [Phycisphaeraceae bacterium]|nr:hypothetical protein [Phycisphaeraceae bacterium]MBX3409889.1 hypothetical protein [Phycisphaeraceae bacterium]